MELSTSRWKKNIIWLQNFPSCTHSNLESRRIVMKMFRLRYILKWGYFDEYQRNRVQIFDTKRKPTCLAVVVVFPQNRMHRQQSQSTKLGSAKRNRCVSNSLSLCSYTNLPTYHHHQYGSVHQLSISCRPTSFQVVVHKLNKINNIQIHNDNKQILIHDEKRCNSRQIHFLGAPDRF